jgi:Tol biopolymer transport system component
MLASFHVQTTGWRGPVSSSLALFTVLLALAACRDHPPTEPIPEEPPEIAFVSERDGNAEIYVVRSDGTQLTRLTYDPLPDRCPGWSPDGRRIAFLRGEEAGSDIWLMNADGSGQSRITEGNSRLSCPSWSPDGTRIAFTRFETSTSDIFVMKSDGTELVNLTPYQARNEFVAWSRDGSRISFAGRGSGAGGGVRIYVANADASGVVVSPIGEWDVWSFSWSPDWRRIAITRREERNGEWGIGISVMNADGSGTPISRGWFGAGSHYARAGPWSPDGTQFVVDASFHAAGLITWLIFADGGQADIRVGEEGYWAHETSWSPDGRRVLYTHQLRAGTTDVIVANADASGPVNLSNHPAADHSPAWSP